MASRTNTGAGGGSKPKPGQHGRSGVSIADLAAALNARIAELATDLLGTPNPELSTSKELRFGTRGSMSVQIAGKGAGQWYDFEADNGGASLELIRLRKSFAFGEAVDWARRWLGEPISRELPLAERPLPDQRPTRAATQTTDPRQNKVDLILRRLKSTTGTPVISYLRRRGITSPPPDSIWFLPNAWGSYGAMVGLAKDDDGEVLAVHLVYLTDDGQKAPIKGQKRTHKRVDGWAERAAARFPGRKPVILCEGLETGLSIWEATGREVWVCLGIANIRKAPVLGHSTVVIARDGDVPGSNADKQILKAVRNLEDQGVTVTVASPPIGEDFNDVLQREGADAVRHHIETTAFPKSPEATQRRKDLTIGSEVEIARRVIEDLSERYGRIVTTEGDVWRFDRTHWRKISPEELRLAVYAYDGANFLTPGGQASSVKLGKARLDSIIFELGMLTSAKDFFEAPAEGINCESGLIRFDSDGTPRLEPHRPEHLARHVLPGRWRPELHGAPPKKSLLHHLLHGCFKDDPESEEFIDLLAEVCGAAALGIATRLRQPRAVILHGRTAENGKSQILALARGLLPPTAVSSIPAAAMSDERHMIGLVGRLLNACDELSAQAIASDVFKSAVTGDRVGARDVFKSRVEFQPVALHLFATNVLPSFRGGLDRGVQRRLLVIPFQRSIPIEERIERIGERIAIEEPDLLLAWAVKGASRLMRNRNFVLPLGCRRALQEWILGDDPVAGWLHNCVTLEPIVAGRPRLRTRDAHRYFLDWAINEGHRSDKLPAINGFVQRVCARLPDLQHTREATGPCFVGMVVKQP
jgi:P4 family phage/plasmid primase-like protien